MRRTGSFEQRHCLHRWFLPYALRHQLDDNFLLRRQLGPCRILHFVLSGIPRSWRNSFFPQAAALPPLLTKWNPKPARPALRQRSRRIPRPDSPGTAGHLFQSRPTSRLRRHLLYFPGRGAPASHLQCHAAFVTAGFGSGSLLVVPTRQSSR